MSAAAFAKGLLDLEGPLTPILVSLVSKDAAMLDYVGSGADHEIKKAKAHIYSAMTGECFAVCMRIPLRQGCSPGGCRWRRRP